MIKSIRERLDGLTPEKKSVFTLVGGTMSAQALNFLFSPIITRIFSPEVFGTISVFTSITGVAGIVACLRYEMAILLPREDDEGFFLLRLCFVLATLVSGALGIAFLFGNRAIFSRFGADGLAVFWFYVPLSLFLRGLVLSSNVWLTRKRRFRVLAANEVVSVVVVNAASIGLGLAGGRDAGVRLFSLAMGYLANAAVVLWAIAPDFRAGRHPKRRGWRELLVKYKSFPLYDVWAALLANLSWTVIPVLMNAFYSSNLAGQYTIGMTLIQVPANVIGSSIAQVFIKNASEKRHRGELYPYCIKTLKLIFRYSVPVMMVVLLGGKRILAFVFGSQWETAGLYSQILSPWSVLWFASISMHGIFTVTQRQKIYLTFAAVNLATRFLSLYVGKVLGGGTAGISLLSASGFVVYGASILAALGEAKKSDAATAK